MSLMLRVERYKQSRKKEWNEFVEKANNATFLFNRGFMDYHSDRFEDYSLMVFIKDKVVACLPANIINNNEVCSHQGLTYGAFIMEKELKLPIQIEIVKSVLEHYHRAGIEVIKYKAFPRFYNLQQTDEVDYCLFRVGAQLYRKDLAIAIDREQQMKYSSSYTRQSKSAIKAGYRVEKSSDFLSFWKNVLIPNLLDRFGVEPVHSIEEIEQLVSKFPENIELLVSRNKSGNIVAGTVFFISENVTHCQYISATQEGRNSGALNLLYTTSIDEHFLDKRYFDFGIANEDNGRSLNDGLLAWKERMGGRGYSHDFYEIETGNYELLNP
jgi:hypothetical protein